MAAYFMQQIIQFEVLIITINIRGRFYHNLYLPRILLQLYTQVLQFMNGNIKILEFVNKWAIMQHIRKVNNNHPNLFNTSYIHLLRGMYQSKHYSSC